MIFRSLIVDDHPLITETYTNVITLISKERNLETNIDIARNCDEALQFLSLRKDYNLCILDIRIPESNCREFISGEDIGIKLRIAKPETKIMICSGLNDNYRINSILKSINPEAFLIKSDINSTELKRSIIDVTKNIPYYSKSVLRQIRDRKANNIALDRIDRRILYLLSKGSKTKDLPKDLPLSIAGIERRKRRLKITFNVENNSDKELLEKAKLTGFI